MEEVKYKKLAIFLALLVVMLGGGLIYKIATYPKPTVKTRTVTRWTKKYVPVPVSEKKGKIPEHIDTMETINNYYTEKTYRDTVVNNDTVTVAIIDTIYQNGIAGREVNFTFDSKRFVKNNSVGLLSTCGYRNLQLLGEYRYKRMKMYAGYDFVNHAPVAGVGYQLFNW